MTEPRRIAVVSNYDELIAALRARADELKVTREGLDAVTGLQNGYSAKLLAPVPIKSLGRVSLGPMLQAMGLAIVLVEDPEALARFGGQLTEKKRGQQSVGTSEIITNQITLRKLRLMASRGGKKRWAKLTPKQRSKAARKAGLASARKRRRKARRARIAAKPAPVLPLAPCASLPRPPNG